MPQPAATKLRLGYDRSMTKHANHRTSVSALMGATVVDARGSAFGHVREFAVAPSVDAAHVYGMVLRLASAKRGDRPSLVPVTELQLTAAGQMQLRESANPPTPSDDETYLLLERDLLDQQIIDIHGHKVVRVNDVDLAWEGYEEGSSELTLRICEVEIGMRGAVRRLLKGLPPPLVHHIASRFGGSVIPWDFVDLIDRDPARCVRLKIEQDRLAQMHPSDIADILEDLAPPDSPRSTKKLPPRPSKRSGPRCRSPSSSHWTPSRLPELSRRWTLALPPTCSPNCPTNAPTPSSRRRSEE